MFNRYFEDELTFLRELGAEFARSNRSAAPFLAERGADPDVERLLEGFAFLTGRLRQKLDDELPELTQSMMQWLWPHYLRPVPALSILEFEPLTHMVKEPMTIPRDSEVASVAVDGTPCRFRTCSPVELLPISLDSAALERPAGTAGVLRLTFRPSTGVALEKLTANRIRFYLHGEPSSTFGLFLQLTRRLKQITVRAAGGAANLPPDSLVTCGFEPEEALLPYPPNAFPGYRLLQEYFALPQKFLFLELRGLPRLQTLGVQGTFEILFEFQRAPDSGVRVGTDNIRLFCTPVANLFPLESDPLRVEHQKVEYRVRPGGLPPDHAAVFSIDKALGLVRGTVETQDIPAFFSFRHNPQVNGGGSSWYSVRLRESVADRQVDTYVSFVNASGVPTPPPAETVSLQLTCTNRTLANQLRVGDITRATDSSPAFARFRNITPVLAGSPPPLGGDLHWRLIASLALNHLSLADVSALRELLGLYDFRALYDRQAARESELLISGIQSVCARPEERLWRGTPIRGQRVEIEMLEENFAGEGEMVLFGAVLSEFFALYSSINSFSRLIARGVKHGEVYEWSPRLGFERLI